VKKVQLASMFSIAAAAGIQREMSFAAHVEAPKQLTDKDLDRIAKAKAKRERKNLARLGSNR